MDAEFVQVVEGLHGLAAAEHGGLGDLDREPVDRQAGVRQDTRDQRGEARLGELAGGDVDAHPLRGAGAPVGEPFHGLGAGGAQDPFAEFDDESVVFRGRDEPVGRDHAAFGVVPADECFHRA